MLLSAGIVCAQKVDISMRQTDCFLSDTSIKLTPKTADNRKDCLIGKETNYVEVDGKWIRTKEMLSTFDDNNRLLVLESLFYGENNKIDSCHQEHVGYDENNNVIRNDCLFRSDLDAEWGPYVMIDYKYDDIIPHYQIEEDMKLWNENDKTWHTCYDSNYYVYIVRDEKNRMREMQGWHDKEKTMPKLGYYYFYEKEDEPATQMILAEKHKTTGNLTYTYYYKDIVWEKSDCQYKQFNSKIYFMFEGDPDNVVKSYTIYSINNDDIESLKKIGDVVYEYGDNFRSSNVYREGYPIVTNLHLTDSKTGNYTHYFYYWNDNNKNGVYDDGEASYLKDAYRYVAKYNDKGYLVDMESCLFNVSTNEFDIPQSRTTKEYKMNSDYDIPEEIITTEYQEGVVMRRTKVVYSDFNTIHNGIEDVSEDKSISLVNGVVKAVNGMDYTVTDIQGRVLRHGIVSDSEVSMNGVSKGMYIVKVGTRSIKVLVE